MDKGLPVVEVEINGNKLRALVDTGCSLTLVKSSVVMSVGRGPEVVAFDGRRVRCRGKSSVYIMVGHHKLFLSAIVVDNMLDGIDVVLGMDAITELGGVTVSGGSIEFGSDVCIGAVGWSTAWCAEEEPSLSIEDKDFSAWFDGQKWIVRWHWRGGQEPELKARIPCFNKGLTGQTKEAFDREVEKWIEEGVLLPADEEGGNLTLMAVEQINKNKVRPVFDFRDLL